MDCAEMDCAEKGSGGRGVIVAWLPLRDGLACGIGQKLAL